MCRCVGVRGGVRAEWTRFERDDNVHTIEQNQFILFLYDVLYIFKHQNICQTNPPSF